MLKQIAQIKKTLSVVKTDYNTKNCEILLKCEKQIATNLKLIKSLINTGADINLQKQHVSNVALLESLKLLCRKKIKKCRAAGAQERRSGAGLRARKTQLLPDAEDEKNLISNRVYWKDVSILFGETIIFYCFFSF